MGFNWCISNGVIFIAIALAPLLVQGLGGINPDSLQDFLQDYATKSLTKEGARTRVLYRVPLPANFSGMQVSMVLLQSGTFWARGANLSYFGIPPRIIASPHVKRLAIVYENLGNWSSHYYKVPGHALISPVIGFMVYNATDSATRWHVKLNLKLLGDHITISYHGLPSPNVSTEMMKCATLGRMGSVRLTNMTRPGVCLVKGQGHFALVVPSLGEEGKKKKKKKKEVWKWWVIKLGAGLLGLVLLGVVGVIIFTLVGRRRLRKMEREAEQGETLGSIWIGRSKMPSAARVRTQPALEIGYVP